jgi:hypothetical protein
MDDIKEQDQTITFHMIKSPGCQTHHVDGVIAGFTPSDGAYLEFYTERGTIPQTVTYKLNADGTLGDAIGTTGKDGIVREIQTGVILDLNGLKSLHARVGSMIDQLEEEASL